MKFPMKSSTSLDRPKALAEKSGRQPRLFNPRNNPSVNFHIFLRDITQWKEAEYAPAGTHPGRANSETAVNGRARWRSSGVSLAGTGGSKENSPRALQILFREVRIMVRLVAGWGCVAFCLKHCRAPRFRFEAVRLGTGEGVGGNVLA